VSFHLRTVFFRRRTLPAVTILHARYANAGSQKRRVHKNRRGPQSKSPCIRLNSTKRNALEQKQESIASAHSPLVHVGHIASTIAPTNMHIFAINRSNTWRVGNAEGSSPLQAGGRRADLDAPPMPCRNLPHSDTEPQAIEPAIIVRLTPHPRHAAAAVGK